MGNAVMEDPILRITKLDDGTVYEARLSDFSGLDAQLFRQVTGMGLMNAFSQPDLDTIAGMIWLIRRRTNRKLPFEVVARQINPTNIEVEAVGGEDDEESGNSSSDADPLT